LGIKNNFCSNCGEKLEAYAEIDECPKCHSALHEHLKHIESPPRVVEQLPYKSPGTTALIAFLGGLFALPGLGHIYVGKVRRGIAILIGGFILYALIFLGIWFIPFPYSWVIIIGYFILLIWQIFNARKYAKKFNELVKTTGKEPW
jgi:hypothetical protein